MIWQSLKRPVESELQPREIWIAYDENGQPALLVDEGLPDIAEDDLVIQCVEATDEDINAAIHLCDKGYGARRAKPGYDWDGNAL